MQHIDFLNAGDRSMDQYMYREIYNCKFSSKFHVKNVIDTFVLGTSGVAIWLRGALRMYFYVSIYVLCVWNAFTHLGEK